MEKKTPVKKPETLSGHIETVPEYEDDSCEDIAPLEQHFERGAPSPMRTVIDEFYAVCRGESAAKLRQAVSQVVMATATVEDAQKLVEEVRRLQRAVETAFQSATEAYSARYLKG